MTSPNDDGWGFTNEDELELSDIAATARLAGLIPGTGRFSRAILAAGYRRTEPPSPRWEFDFIPAPMPTVDAPPGPPPAPMPTLPGGDTPPVPMPVWPQDRATDVTYGGGR